MIPDININGMFVDVSILSWNRFSLQNIHTRYIILFQDRVICVRRWDDNKRWIFIKYCVDYYYTSFVPVLLKMLLQWQPEPFNRKRSGRFSAVKSDSTHHFFGNACTKSGPLRFSQFSGWLMSGIIFLTDQSATCLHLKRVHAKSCCPIG
jgi:hypothetical protein